MTRQARPGCTLAWIEPSYVGTRGPRQLVRKIGGRTAWAADAFDAYVASLGRPRAQVREELAAALDQVPKMVPFWHAADPQHESVTHGLARQWDAWLGGVEALRIA